MRSEEAQRFFRIIDIAGVLANKLPESINVSKLLDVVQDGIIFLIQTGRQRSDKDILSRAAVQTGEDCHNVYVELQRSLILSPDLAQFSNAILVLKELSVEFHRLSHCRCCSNAEFAHLHGDEVSAVFLTEQFNIPQPILLLINIGEWIVDQIVAGGIVVEKHLLHGKVVRTGELYNLYSR